MSCIRISSCVLVILQGLNISDSMTKSMTINTLLSHLPRNKLQIVTKQKDEIRRKLPASKHYILYPEEVEGGRIWTTSREEERGCDLANLRAFASA